jgi:hypothetical protein
LSGSGSTLFLAFDRRTDAARAHEAQRPLEAEGEARLVRAASAARDLPLRWTENGESCAMRGRLE